MSSKPVSLSAGQSVYCVNEAQMAGAERLYAEESSSGLKIRQQIEQVEATMSRNERAALAFMLVHRLKSHPHK